MTKLKIWTFDATPKHGIVKPIETTCDERKFLPTPCDSDDDGRRMFVNTHFRTEAEAWAKLLAEAEACESLDASEYRQAQHRLAVARAELASTAAFVVDVRKAMKERLEP